MDFLTDWLRNARKWFVYVTAGSMAYAVFVAAVVAISHALAWIGGTYGGTALLVVVVVLCGLVVAGGSAVQTCVERKK